MMVKEKGVVLDCRTGEAGEVEVDLGDRKPRELKLIDLDDLAELIEVAKDRGWIKKKVIP